MVLNHLLFLVLLLDSLVILVLATNYGRGFSHPHCSPLIRYNPIYLPHLTDCRKFYECDLGLAYEFQCPSEMHFNPDINGCDTPEKVLCRNDRLKILEGTRQQPKTKTVPAELPVKTRVKVLPTTKTSLDKYTLQTIQENTSVSILASTEVPPLANISNHINHHNKTSSRPYVASNSTTISRKNHHWNRYTKPANVTVMTRKGTSVDKMFFTPSVTTQALPEQTITSWLTTRPRLETIMRATRSTTSTYKKKSSHLKQKDIPDERERTTSISRNDVGDFKKIVFFGPITNNDTIGENSVLNKSPVKKMKAWTKTSLPVKWKKQ